MRNPASCCLLALPFCFVAACAPGAGEEAGSTSAAIASSEPSIPFTLTVQVSGTSTLTGPGVPSDFGLPNTVTVTCTPSNNVNGEATGSVSDGVSPTMVFDGQDNPILSSLGSPNNTFQETFLGNANEYDQPYKCAALVVPTIPGLQCTANDAVLVQAASTTIPFVINMACPYPTPGAPVATSSAVTNPGGTAVVESNVTFSWSAVNDALGNAASYTLLVKDTTVPDASLPAISLPAGRLSYTLPFSELHSGHTYTWTVSSLVTAVVPAGTGGTSAPASFTVPASTAVPTVPAFPAPTPQCGMIGPNQGLSYGAGGQSSMSSCGGDYLLNMQPDGNLVLYSLAGAAGATWFDHGNGVETYGTLGYALYMQGDGNLVVYDQYSQALWFTGTQGHPGAFLNVQGNDGNLVIYNKEGTSWLWQSGTASGATNLQSSAGILNPACPPGVCE